MASKTISKTTSKSASKAAVKKDAKKYFPELDLDFFWDDDELALEEYVDSAPDDTLIASIETELGYKLPASYIALMKLHNGGVPYATCFPLPVKDNGEEQDYIEITGFLSIGRKKMNSLCGAAGNKLFKDAWHYPDYGVYICDCPSAGFDLILLDYRYYGPDGEPSVAYVNVEDDIIVPLAPDFATFVQGLVEESELISLEMNRVQELMIVEEGDFSPLLIKMCRNCGIPQAEQWMRSVARNIVDEKSYFALHEDPLSWLMYDLQYLLYSFAFPKASVKQYLHDYPLILAEDGEFTTNGYAPAFVADWMEARVKEGKLKPAGVMVGQKNSLVFTTETMEDIVLQCKAIAEKYDL